MNNNTEREYITEQEARSVISLFRKCLKSYKVKEASLSDEQWLAQWFCSELPEITPEEARKDAGNIVTSVDTYGKNLLSVNEAAQNGISKEKWIADKLQEGSVGVSVNEFGERLAHFDSYLARANEELADRLSVSVNGNLTRINMNPNLDGFIAEEMIAETTQLSADLQGKPVIVEVPKSNTRNSVDVTIRDIVSNEKQRFQLKFGKDAKATIDLIERGNYNNQRIIVPSEQLEEVQAHFRAKGSQKTITDHIEAFGVKGKSFTKEEMKSLQKAAQEDGIMPSMDYSHYSTKELATSIGKSAGIAAMLSATIITGYNVISKFVKREKIESDQLVADAVRTGADTTLKTVTAGTLQVAVRKGVINFIPKGTPAGIIAQVACVGVENIKTLIKVASGEMSVTKGLDQMGRTTVSMSAGLLAGADLAGFGATVGFAVGGPIGGVVAGLVSGMVGYCAGSKVGEAVYNGAKKVAEEAKKTVKAVRKTMKTVGHEVKKGAERMKKEVQGLLN